MAQSSLTKRGVIFDVDGTLADTNYLHVIAWARAFREAGEDVNMADIHHLIGMGSDLLVARLIGREDEKAVDGPSRFFRDFVPEIRALPGAADLLVEVHRRGAMVVLASSANSEQLEAMLKAVDAPDGTIDHVVGADDVDRSKPEPDIFAAALDASGLDPGDAIVVGDTVWDIEAAEKLGLRVVGVASGGISRCQLDDAGAVAVYDDCADLLGDIDASPLALVLRARAGS